MAGGHRPMVEAEGADVSGIGRELELAWDAWSDLVTGNAAMVIALGVVAVALLIGGVWWARRRNRIIIVPEARTDLVRRPRYLDGAVLSDVLAHVESTDHGRSLRNVLEYQESTDEARAVALRTEQVRALNKALDASHQRADLATVLDESVEELPESGMIIEARGRIRILPASEAARLLIRARTLLSPAWLPPTAPAAPEPTTTSGALLTEPARTITTVQDRPPVVAALDTRLGRLLMVLDEESRLDGVRDGEVVSLLGVIGRPLSRREPARPEEYLPDHLPGDVRDALRGRDVGEVASHLAEAVGQDLDRKSMIERGPGAMVRPAAIW